MLKRFRAKRRHRQATRRSAARVEKAVRPTADRRQFARSGCAQSPRRSGLGQPAAEIGLAAQRGKGKERDGVVTARPDDVGGNDHRRRGRAFRPARVVAVSPVGGTCRLWCGGTLLMRSAAAGPWRRRQRATGMRPAALAVGGRLDRVSTADAAARFRFASHAGRLAGTCARDDARQGRRDQQQAGDQSDWERSKHANTRECVIRLLSSYPNCRRSTHLIAAQHAVSSATRKVPTDPSERHSRFAARAPGAPGSEGEAAERDAALERANGCDVGT